MPDQPTGIRSALSARYDVVRELGRGGMAVVYLARDKELDREVALKVLHPDLAASIGSERFLREIEIAAKLTHPHILPVYDRGRAGNFLYYTMPYLDGESLRDRLRREKQLPIEDAVRITTEVADALGYAHEQRIIHRDIKPENILFQGGHAVVADFGIARAVTAAGGEQLTETGLVVGTPAYMSPEQGSGTGELDGRSDLYSLGCVLYEMLSGETPHLGNTPMAIIAKKMSEPAPRISVVRETVPAAVEVALTTVLARNPVDRYATGSDFSQALTAEGVTRPRRARRVSRMRWLAAAAAVALIGVGTWVGLTRWRSALAPVSSSSPVDSTAIAVLPFQVIGDSASPATRDLRGDGIGFLFDKGVPEQLGRRIVYPGSVLEQWRAAGGSPGSALSAEQELEIGRRMRVGTLVQGTIVVSDTTVELAARMVDVGTGATRVPLQRVEGSVRERFDLVNQLIVLLFSQDRGWTDEAARALMHNEPEAVQTYIAASRAAGLGEEQRQLFKDALRLDSSLIDAALWTYAAGERTADTVELRYALEHQDQLSARAQEYVTILAGKAFGTLTGRQVLEAYEDLARRWPEWGVPQAELGASYFTFGALAGVTDWRRRARNALERASRDNEWALFHLAELAFLQQDTARARELTQQLLRMDRLGSSWTVDWPTAYPWRLATLSGRTSEAQQALDSVLIPLAVFAMAYADGRGIADADSIMAGIDHDIATPQWALARGRYREFREGWVRNRSSERPRGAMWDVYLTLFRGVPADSATKMAVETLRRIVEGTGPQTTPNERAMAEFWTALWRLSSSDSAGIGATIGRLSEEGRRWGQFAVCALMLDAVRVEVAGGDARTALLRLDSAARTLPMPTVGMNAFLHMPPEVQNLYLSRALRKIGETDRALAASRRRYYGAYSFWVDALPEYLREEGRLAAELGDTAGAVRAYEHYLALRSDPEPPWRAEWEQVRTELGALVQQ